MSIPPSMYVFARLSGLMTEGRQRLWMHCMRYGQPDPIIMLVVTRLRSFDEKMQKLVALWRAGKLVTRLRPKRPRPPKPPAAADDPPKDTPLRLPQGFGWLNKRVGAAGIITADQLRVLLADPDILALIAATPRAGRLLRPICQMYGIKFEPILLPKRPRRKRPETEEQRTRRAWRAEARAFAEMGKTSSKKSVVPPGHTFPTNERDWAIYWGRVLRADRRRRGKSCKSA